MTQYKSTGTPLTDHQRELLTILVKECADVAQRCTEALLFGLDGVQPGQPFDNEYRLCLELGDLQCVVEKMLKSYMIEQEDIKVGYFHKQKQLERWMQHQED